MRGAKAGDAANWRTMAFVRDVAVAENMLLGAGGAGTEWDFEYAQGSFKIEFRGDGFNHFVCNDYPAHAHWTLGGANHDELTINWDKFGVYVEKDARRLLLYYSYYQLTHPASQVRDQARCRVPLGRRRGQGPAGELAQDGILPQPVGRGRRRRAAALSNGNEKTGASHRHMTTLRQIRRGYYDDERGRGREG
jgi:hypothetical protein